MLEMPPEIAPPPLPTPLKSPKITKFNSVNGKKGRILVKIVVSVEIEGKEQVVLQLHTRIFSKNGKIWSKIAKNRKKFGIYSTLTHYCGSHEIFGLWGLCYIHRAQLDEQNISE